MKTIISEIDKFKYEFGIGDYLVERNKGHPCATRYLEIDKWLEENVGDYIMGWYDGGQFGWWVLGVNNMEDYLAFKLRFGPLR